MRVDAWGKGGAAGKKVTLRCVHPDLKDCVGRAAVAAAAAGRWARPSPPSHPAGVWFPANLPGPARANILRVAREGASVWDGLPTP